MKQEEWLLAAALSKYGGIYGTKLRAIAEYYGSLQSLYKLYQRNKLKVEAVVLPLVEKSWHDDALASVRAAMNQYGVMAHTTSSPFYPASLAQIDDPPFVLYVQGDISVLTTMCIGIVGTRAMSLYGKRVVASLLRPLAGMDVCIVSGLALGIDAEVHREALGCRLPVAAVLGGGLDRYEPVTNARLGQEVAKAGCILSEYPPGVRPQKHHFLERNRIIAGLSQAVVVVEGKAHSGSLVTARLALKYGREVGGVPGDVFAPNSEGPLQLMSEGAWVIRSGADMLDMLGISRASSLAESTSDNPILNILQSGPLSFDSLCVETGMSLVALQSALTTLELDGKVTQTASGLYCLCA